MMRSASRETKRVARRNAETRIAQDESPLRLLQDKVIVFRGAEVCRLHAQSAAHPQMQAEPVPAGKLEEHLFAARAGAEETAAADLSSNFFRIGAAEDALLVV